METAVEKLLSWTYNGGRRISLVNEGSLSDQESVCITSEGYIEHLVRLGGDSTRNRIGSHAI